MASLTQVREGEVQFDLHTPDGVPEIFVDGISQAMIGFPCTKILFHSVQAPPAAGTAGGVVEQRQAVLRLTIGSDTLAEMCRKLLAVLERDDSGMETAAGQYLTRLRGQEPPA
ncbi:hypothetical protein Thi970DRAFT_00279 [Thiorhodovibrio frisius]|uniref:Uncharacterized protein n=2 Tax=Thiorhodovibrio frisius TaxID=631362 RepID=H8YVX7_9GAMM|nr:hypothetical protein Thi970DRAFT_00279 [Thiorhodovibrio frisius]WPL20182.1 hypothetical protein Thiofri_00250 [Thiorhodovibrio frisius]